MKKKMKLLTKAISLMLCAAMIFTALPLLPAKAEETPVEDTGHFVYNDDFLKTLDLMALDWKNCTDEAISHAVMMKDWYEIGVWLNAMSEADLNELLARNTDLHSVIPKEGVAEEEYQTVYEYALEVYESMAGEVYASYPSNTSGYWTTNIVNGVNGQTCSIKHKITGFDKDVTWGESQSLKLTPTISGINWCGATCYSGNTNSYASLGGSTYTTVLTNMTYNKPAGYTAVVTYSSTSSMHKLYYDYGASYVTTSTKELTNSDVRRIYPVDERMTAYNASTYAATIKLISLVNAYSLAGVGLSGTTSFTGENLTQTITLVPINYNVNYNGNGSTSGGVSAQNCTFGKAYTTQGNGFSRNYTVTYNGNGGISDEASQTANYTFKGWGANTPAKVTHAAGATYSNLTTTSNGTVTMYALWNPASIKLPSATRTGYQFSKWDIGAAGATYTPTKNVTATASWTANNYDVQLDANGGVFETDIDYEENDEDAAVETIAATYDVEVELPTPVKDGYVFNGWTGAGGTYKETAKNLTADNEATVALTASWSASTGTPYTINRYFQQNKNNSDKSDPNAYKNVAEDDLGNRFVCPLPGTEVRYGTTDSTITVPAETVEGFETPDAQMVTIAGDGSTVIDFYYNVKSDEIVKYYVEHYVKTSPTGSYGLYKKDTWQAATGTVTTPPYNQGAVDYVNKVDGCECQKPALQTITVSDGLVVKYYYDCVKKGTAVQPVAPSTGGLTDIQINEIIKKLAAGLSFSMDIDGAKYEIIQNPDGTLGIKFITTEASKVVIPDVIKIGDKVYRITEIYNKAFYNNKKLKEVVLSANISKIGNSAFEGCTGLEKVTLHEGLVTIGNRAFYGCTSLKSITLPSTVKTIGNNAFQNCTALKTVKLNYGLVKIGNKAFYNCKALTKISIPKTVLKIGTYTFGKCTKLKKVTFVSGSQLLSMGTGVFYNCKSLTNIKMPSKLTNVPNKAFYNCKKLKSVTIGKSVTKIGSNAFRNCAKITKITIPSKVQTVGSKAFYNCKKLKKVTINSRALTSVGSKAFKKCKNNIVFKVPNSKISSYSGLLKGKY
nr:leucine-rich repeat protein [Lachnospiraceae bacterium]